MNRKQLNKTIRKLLYRKRLSETVEEIEGRIKIFLAINNKEEEVTEDYLVKIVNDNLNISKRPQKEFNQLDFFKQNSQKLKA